MRPPSPTDEQHEAFNQDIHGRFSDAQEEFENSLKRHRDEVKRDNDDDDEHGRAAKRRRGPASEWGDDDDALNTDVLEREGGVDTGADSKLNLAMAAARERANDQRHVREDRKNDGDDLKSRYAAAAAAAAAVEGGGEGGGGPPRGRTDTNSLTPLDDRERRLALFEQIPNKDRICPMCAVSASRSSYSEVIKGEIEAFHKTLHFLDKLAESSAYFKPDAIWVNQIKTIWDLRLKPFIKADPANGIMHSKPDWSYDSILFHYLRENPSPSVSNSESVSDLRTLKWRIKAELMTSSSDGSRWLNRPLLMHLLKYDTELRSRLKDHLSRANA